MPYDGVIYMYENGGLPITFAIISSHSDRYWNIKYMLSPDLEGTDPENHIYEGLITKDITCSLIKQKVE